MIKRSKSIESSKKTLNKILKNLIQNVRKSNQKINLTQNNEEIVARIEEEIFINSNVDNYSSEDIFYSHWYQNYCLINKIFLKGFMFLFSSKLKFFKIYFRGGIREFNSRPNESCSSKFRLPEPSRSWNLN